MKLLKEMVNLAKSRLLLTGHLGGRAQEGVGGYVVLCQGSVVRKSELTNDCKYIAYKSGGNS